MYETQRDILEHVTGFQSQLNTTLEESDFMKMQITGLKSTLNKTAGELKDDINLLNHQFTHLASVTSDIKFRIVHETQTDVPEPGSGLPCHLNLIKNQFVSIIRVEAIQESLQNQINMLQISLICGPGLWQRVAFLNVSDPLQQCPPAWREYSANGVRGCGCPRNLSYLSCSSMRYSSSYQYRRVCGRVTGYQVGSTDVFYTQNPSIDTAYVDGVSITTSGVPCIHVWTYVAGLSEQLIPGLETSSCPCRLQGTSYTAQVPPSFVGNNYYCESGNPLNTYQQSDRLTYTNDPLWDGH